MTDAPDLVLYHGTNSRSLRARWMLEEMGLPYRLEPVAFDRRPIGDEAYGKIHPLRKVPVLRDGSDLVRDSIAIMEYLAARHGPTDLVLDPGEAEYGRFLEYLQFGESGMLMPLNLVVAHTALLPEDQRNPSLAKWGRMECDKLLEYIETTGLADGRDYLAGGRFTAADISVGYSVYLLKILRQFDRSATGVDAWFKRITARDAWKRASAG